MVKNPVPMSVRGAIYVASKAVNAGSLIAVAVLVMVGLPEWAPIPAVIANAVGVFAADLAKENLAAVNEPMEVHDSDVL